jgi:flagellar hook-basal body complex protein FliE
MIAGLGGIGGITGLGSGAEQAGAAAKTASSEKSLATLFGDMVGDTVSTLEGAEHLSMQALKGNADTRAVVDAVMSAEQSLQTAIAIRDKIVTAYLEISRMAI